MCFSNDITPPGQAGMSELAHTCSLLPISADDAVHAPMAHKIKGESIPSNRLRPSAYYEFVLPSDPSEKGDPCKHAFGYTLPSWVLTLSMSLASTPALTPAAPPVVVHSVLEATRFTVPTAAILPELADLLRSPPALALGLVTTGATAGAGLTRSPLTSSSRRCTTLGS